MTLWPKKSVLLLQQFVCDVLLWARSSLFGSHWQQACLWMPSHSWIMSDGRYVISPSMKRNCENPKTATSNSKRHNQRRRSRRHCHCMYGLGEWPVKPWTRQHVEMDSRDLFCRFCISFLATKIRCCPYNLKLICLWKMMKVLLIKHFSISFM